MCIGVCIDVCIDVCIERDTSASAASSARAPRRRRSLRRAVFFFLVMRSVFATSVTDHESSSLGVGVVYRVHAFDHVLTTPDRPAATARLPLPHRLLCARIPCFNHKRTHTLSTRDSGSCRARLMRARRPSRRVLITPAAPSRRAPSRFDSRFDSPAPTTKHLRIMFT